MTPRHNPVPVGYKAIVLLVIHVNFLMEKMFVNIGNQAIVSEEMDVSFNIQNDWGNRVYLLVHQVLLRRKPVGKTDMTATNVKVGQEAENDRMLSHQDTNHSVTSSNVNHLVHLLLHYLLHSPTPFLLKGCLTRQ